MSLGLIVQNELVDSVLSHLTIKDLVRVSSVCRSWYKSARLIYRARISDAFHELGPFRYVFGTTALNFFSSKACTNQEEASQPAENAVQGNILKLRDRLAGLSPEELSVPPTCTAFDFSTRVAGPTNIYKFTLEADTFIQLCVLGNIIEPRKGGGLEGVAQHLDDFCRIKPENIDISLGGIRTFTINDHCSLAVRLSKRGARMTDLDTEEGPVEYEIEVRRVNVVAASY